MKLGQFLATRPDVVGVEVARRLEALQDHMPPFGQAEAVKVIEGAFNRKVDDIFVAFGLAGRRGVDCAVHRARVRDKHGERDVAVK